MGGAGDEPLDLACAGKTTEPAKSALLPLPDAIQWYVVIGRNGCTARRRAVPWGSESSENSLARCLDRRECMYIAPRIS